MEHIDQLAEDLIALLDDGQFIFPEYYPHTDKIMWKVLNPYTNYASDKIVLSPVSEGMLKALAIAVPLITKKKNEYERSKNTLI